MASINAINNANSVVLLRSDSIASGSPVAELDYASVTDASFNSYLLLANNVGNPATTGTILYIQISTDGGMTYITTGYATSGAGGPGMGLLFFNDVSTDTLNIQTYLQNMSSGNGYITTLTNSIFYDSSGMSATTNTVGGVYTTLSTTANAFRLVTDDGSDFYGDFYLYGCRS